ncbi:MAG TPA: hypothetical protein VKB51_08230 [bacterium]|nr:hypothetical protein [bacterium]
MMHAATTRAGRAALLLLALLIGGAAAAMAAPRFTNKDTALELAKVLDKGVFRGKLISSTFVQSPEVGDYQIKVVLDDGTELNWNIDQVRLWSQDDSITLQKNRVLVFPSLETNEFGILDKNEFTRKALRARVYAKYYSGSDVLAGQVIDFAIRRFNLVDLLKLHPGRDELGNQYHYVLDFETGQREFLSYLDAWRTLNRNGLLDEPGTEPVMHDTYKLESLKTIPLHRIVENGTGTFGVEMQFDRPVQLRPGHYPFRLYERKPGKTSTPLDNNFVLEITAPNAVMTQPVNRFDALEFLNEIHAVPDGEHQNRVLLRAMIAPEVLTQPPEVAVTGRNVSVVFTKVEDQSVFDRKALHEAELKRKQERLLAPTLTPPEVEQRRLYRQHMETGLGQMDKARAQSDLTARYEIMLASLANFREAAIQASSDLQLEEALRQRNYLIERLPGLILEHAQAVAGGASGDKAKALALVRAAMELTQEPKMQQSLTAVAKRLGG